MRRLIGLLLIVGSIALAFPAAALAQGTCWLAEDEFVDTRVGELEEPGYIVSVEGPGLRTVLGQRAAAHRARRSVSGYPKVFYVDELEPLMLVPDTAGRSGVPMGSMTRSTCWPPGRIGTPSSRPAMAGFRRGLPPPTELPLRRRRLRRRRAEDLNPLHDQLRPARLPRLTSEEIVNQGNAAVAAITCAPAAPSMPIRLKISRA